MAIQAKYEKYPFQTESDPDEKKSIVTFDGVFTMCSFFSTIAILGVLCLLLSEVSARFDHSHGGQLALTPMTTTKTIKYGPFTVSDMMTNNGMNNYRVESAETPCQDCFITFIQAGLEYPNGSYANANTSLWLHHTVLFNVNQTDVVCSSATDSQRQRWFASGNERTAFDFSENGTIKAGYYISPTDQFAFQTELMNQAKFPQEAVLTMTYSYIPSSPSTSSLAHITPIWLDIGGCGNPDMHAFANTTFNYTSPPWKSTVGGRVLAASGHVHDGGTDIKILNGDTTLSHCDLAAKYGQTSGFIDGPESINMGGVSGGGEMQYMGMHISSIESCKGMEIKKGDVLSVQAMYDTRKYAPMMGEGGVLEDIMGISILYVA